MELKRSGHPHFNLDVIAGPEGIEQFSDLLDRSFQVPRGQHFLEDFPVWDERYVPAGPRCVRAGAFIRGGRLVASAAVRTASLKGGHGTYPVALIGAVATDEEYRGYGLATHLVSFATEWARGKGAAAVFLWGSEHEFYRRQGFELCGTQFRVPLAELDLAADPAETPREGWTPAIFDRMLSRTSGLALEPEDRSWVEAHRSVRWFTVGSEGAIKAYAAIGRGIDLQGIVHEWGGENKALLALLATLRDLFPGASLLAPADLSGETGLIPRGFKVPPPEYLCLAKILDPDRVFRACHPGIPFASRRDKGKFHVSLGDLPELELSERGLSRLFFGSLGSGTVEPEFGPGHPVARASYFPLPLWIWGLDAA